jgi:hypothetical protein
MIRAALRRFLTLLVALSAVTVAVALLVALLADASALRSISVGFYGLGAVLMLVGFFVGNRGPVRTEGDPGPPLFGALMGTRKLRVATAEEREESINMSVILVLLGFVLIVFGVVTDTRYELY